MSTWHLGIKNSKHYIICQKLVSAVIFFKHLNVFLELLGILKSHADTVRNKPCNRFSLVCCIIFVLHHLLTKVTLNGRRLLAKLAILGYYKCDFPV